MPDMTLSAGTKVGPYEVVGAIGAGGMGEVYRARDTKLGREVALKVLPEAFATEAERMGRFEREAKLLASLNHPNIASIFGFEDSGGVHALVMELVEGQTLAERIGEPGTRGAGPRGAGLKAGATQAGAAGAMPVDEALPIAKQIAEGLEYAHERGIVHRDLKPANVKITPDGVVKILDFGLAKALEGDTASSGPSTSPTLSHMATQAGVILGTAAYMSPEQAKGKPVDRRADIWAFGCVLYEMLTGKPAFGGETVTDILAAVVTKEPDWSALSAATPTHVRVLLQRCLRRDPKQRLRDIGEARIAIEGTLAGADSVATTTHSGPAMRASPVRRGLPWALAGVLAILAALFAPGYFKRAPQPTPAVVSQILAPSGNVFALGGSAAGPPALSPDGQLLAFAAIGSDGIQRIWIRRMDSGTAQPVAGTEGGTYPFWSPHGRNLGFFANHELSRVGASGGPVIAVCDALAGRGGSWSRDDTILFTPSTDDVIYRVPASGGTPTPVTKFFEPGEHTNRWPQFLPDGKHFLYYAQSDLPGRSGTLAASLDGGAPKLLVRGDSNGVYAPPGYLLFIRQGTLMAQRFDAATLRLTGRPRALAVGAVWDPSIWRGMFAISGNGTLIYEQGTSSSGDSGLLWVDRNGKQLQDVGTKGNYADQSLSPDGSKLAVAVGGTRGSNIWVFDLVRNVKSRLTVSQDAFSPAWSPDGKWIAFASLRGDLPHIYEKAADGTGKSEPLVVDNAGEFGPEWSADGRFLLYNRAANTPGSRVEIWAMPMFGDRKPFPVIQSGFPVAGHALSPDGKWLAYTSPQGGTPQVYIQAFPQGGRRWQVSTDNAYSPEWSRDGKELFYFSLADQMIMSAPVSERGGSLTVGKVAALFRVNLPTNVLLGTGHGFSVSPDGKRFLVKGQTASQVSQATHALTLIVNWPALLKKP